MLLESTQYTFKQRPNLQQNLEHNRRKYKTWLRAVLATGIQKRLVGHTPGDRDLKHFCHEPTKNVTKAKRGKKSQLPRREPCRIPTINILLSSCR